MKKILVLIFGLGPLVNKWVRGWLPHHFDHYKNVYVLVLLYAVGDFN